MELPSLHFFREESSSTQSRMAVDSTYIPQSTILSDVGVISLLFPNDVGSILNIVGGISGQHRVERRHQRLRWSHSWLRFRDCDHYLYCTYTRPSSIILLGTASLLGARPDPFPPIVLADHISADEPTSWSRHPRRDV